MAARLLPILALAFPGDGLNCVLGGVLRGAGQQGLGAAINFVTYWCLGLPMVWFLAFKQGLGITGIWIGLAATTTLQVLSRESGNGTGELQQNGMSIGDRGVSAFLRLVACCSAEESLSGPVRA